MSGARGVLWRAALAAAAVVMLGVAAPGAWAGQFQVLRVGPYPWGGHDSYVVYKAFGGEPNRVTVSYSSATQTLRLHDAGVRVIVPVPSSSDVPDLGDPYLPPTFTRCRFVLNTVTCHLDLADALLQLGDGNDVAGVQADRLNVTIWGEAGDDVLECSAGACAADLFGGPGDDVLRGGAGNDRLFGGRGPMTFPAAAGTTRSTTPRGPWASAGPKGRTRPPGST